MRTFSGTTTCRLKSSWPILVLFTVAAFCSTTTQAQTPITFDPLPSLGTFYSTGNYSGDGLDVVIGWANGFIDVVQPNSLPYDFIQEVINLTENDKSITDKYEVDELVWKGVDYMLGFIICFLIGLLYILIIPIVCFCFCCCRCCGNCGGKRKQKVTKFSTCKRIYFSISLLLITAVMGVGVACTSLSNDWITKSNKEIYDSFNNILIDSIEYLDGTVTQLDHIAVSEFQKTSDYFIADLENVGYRLGVPIQEYTNTTVQPLFTSVEQTSKHMDDSLATLERVEETQTELTDYASNLTAALDKTADELNGTVYRCGNYCSGIDTSVLTISMNFSSLPSIEEQLEELEKIANSSFSDEIEQVKENFNNLPELITNQTANATATVAELIDEVAKNIEDVMNNATSLVSEIRSEVADISESADEVWDDIKKYDDYRYYTIIGLACLTLLIVVLNIAGLSMGTCGTKKDAHPMERTRLSNAGGNILMAGVTFTFFFSWLLVLLVMIMFFVLGNISQMCEPLHSLEIFEETVDQPYLLNQNGYLLGELVYGNASINLTVSGILNDCHDDMAIYGALKLENILDISQFTNYRENVDIDEALDDLADNIDLSDIDIFTDDMENTLRDFQVSLSNLSFAEYEEELNGNITEVNLTEYAADLRAISSDLVGVEDTIAEELNKTADDLDRIQDELVEPMENSIDTMLVDLAILNETNELLHDSIDDIIDEAIEAEATLQSNATVDFIVKELSNYSEELLYYTDEYVDYSVHQIMEEAGRCKPIRTVYDSAVVALCDYALDSLHLIWFTLGWCVFFYIPSIIFAVKLAKYYRIMTVDADQIPKKKGKKKKKKKDDVENLAMKDMNGTTDNTPDGGLDTNQLIVEQHPPPGVAGYHAGAKSNPTYIHDTDPIMAYNYPIGGAQAPPPYNDPERPGRAAAYQYRPLPAAPNAIQHPYDNRSSVHQPYRHQDSLYGYPAVNEEDYLYPYEEPIRGPQHPNAQANQIASYAQAYENASHRQPSYVYAPHQPSRQHAPRGQSKQTPQGQSRQTPQGRPKQKASRKQANQNASPGQYGSSSNYYKSYGNGYGQPVSSNWSFNQNYGKRQPTNPTTSFTRDVNHLY
ncbi:prominin-1-A-like isoform X2 [Glandiceps talaboti]